MFDLSKIFDLSKKFALPDTFLKSKNYCTWKVDELLIDSAGKLMALNLKSLTT